MPRNKTRGTSPESADRMDPSFLFVEQEHYHHPPQSMAPANTMDNLKPSQALYISAQNLTFPLMQTNIPFCP